MCVVGGMVTRVRAEVKDLEFESHNPTYIYISLQQFPSTRTKDHDSSSPTEASRPRLLILIINDKS